MNPSKILISDRRRGTRNIVFLFSSVFPRAETVIILRWISESQNAPPREIPTRTCMNLNFLIGFQIDSDFSCSFLVEISYSRGFTIPLLLWEISDQSFRHTAKIPKSGSRGVA